MAAAFEPSEPAQVLAKGRFTVPSHSLCRARENRVAIMQHVEKHFSGGDTVRDVVIGMADGLTVPFALAAGISGAIASTHIVVTAGLAEVAAGSIAMGLGGFLAARGDAEHYHSELRREEQEIVEVPEKEAQEITDLFKN